MWLTRDDTYTNNIHYVQIIGPSKSVVGAWRKSVF